MLAGTKTNKTNRVPAASTCRSSDAIVWCKGMLAGSKTNNNNRAPAAQTVVSGEGAEWCDDCMV